MTIQFQGSASETTLLCMLTAKVKSIRRLKKLHPELSEGEISNRLIAYTSGKRCLNIKIVDTYAV